MTERTSWANLITPRGWILGVRRLPHLTETASGWWRPGEPAPATARARALLVGPQADEPVAPSHDRGRRVDGLRGGTVESAARGLVPAAPPAQVMAARRVSKALSRRPAAEGRRRQRMTRPAGRTSPRRPR